MSGCWFVWLVSSVYVIFSHPELFSLMSLLLCSNNKTLLSTYQVWFILELDTTDISTNGNVNTNGCSTLCYRWIRIRRVCWSHNLSVNVRQSKLHMSAKSFLASYMWQQRRRLAICINEAWLLISDSILLFESEIEEHADHTV